ncbi:unnamed protein product [Pelagomonas calceolata]|uniref:Ion transport domain-containing protein n=1 Tax=Pelagomonas calceolata TaxID=35677 RepID=A0A8J2SJ18_9STRA|nr:unnamed protein product [Pelagomonas calceolata]|mmetsp:Transcript_11324/g.33540  ORF Transcript_11324/g.33540 Transcript_11324/m.33540 type:complete len:642 (-) Transcript_11324:1231-3156(-)
MRGEFSGAATPNVKADGVEMESICVGAFASPTPKGGDDMPFSPRSEIECATEAAKSMAHTEAGNYTIAPDRSRAVQNWDVAICVALIYTALVTPAEVGFIHDRNKKTIQYYWAFFACTQIVNLVFIFDVGLQFFLHYQDAQGTWIRNHRRIIKHYLYGSFCIDFVSSIPYGALTLAFPAVGNAQALRLLRLLRLAKLLRIIRSSRLVNRYRADMSVSYGVVQLVGFVLLAVLFCHWMACVWGFVGHFQVSNSEDFPHNSWMGAFEGNDVEGNPWYKWNIRNPKHQYVIALYFSIMTLTTVGYGDVLATTIPEYALMVIIMFVGGFMWAYIIGAVCAVTATLDIKKIEHQQLYDQINSMLVDMSIDRSTAARVRSFMFQSEEMERRDAYSELVEFLSPELQGLMCDEISARTLGKVNYFVSRTNRFRFAIYKALTRRLYVPQELIHEDRLLIIANQGVVGSDGRIYTRGMALNTDFFLQCDEIREAGTLITRALNYVELELLSRRDFALIVRQFPAERPYITAFRVFYALRRRVARGDLLEAPSTGSGETDFGACFDAVRRDPLAIVGCPEDFRDNAALVHEALKRDASLIRYASARLRGDARFVRRAITAAGAGWPESVLPHVSEDLRGLLTTVCGDDSLL